MQKSLIVMVLLLTLCLAGCLSKPTVSGKTGNLKLMITPAETNTAVTQAIITAIKQLQVTLTKDHTSNEYLYPFTSGVNQIEINGIYPGEWAVAISGLDSAGDAIFFTSLKVQIEPGTTTTAAPTLGPAPGKIDIRFNATAISGFGTTYKEATFYSYPNGSSESKSEPLTMEGDYFRGIITLSEGTYQAKIAVPKVDKAVYISPYFRIDIQAGKTTQYKLDPDGSITLNAVIDSTPTTPQDLKATYNSTLATVTLEWNPITDSDLDGYTIYRTDSDGRFRKISDLAATAQSHAESISSLTMTKIGYAVSSFDRGGNHSLWSDPVYITK